ncbi:MAG: tetratricopeptide (TPR) repeat protein [Cyclobacteriaceae bacterium]|jgi:tetratricopeptide (TPR) repeat protein
MRLYSKHVLSICFFLGLSTLAISQPGWNWGDSIDIAKEKNALYTDMLKSKQYKGASKHLEWLLKNTPDLNKSIYINGASIYEGLSEEAKEPAVVLKYQAKVLEMYDLRIKYFDEEPEVLNRKALAAYKYYKGESSKYQELMDLFKKTFELNGNDFYSSNLTAYMDVVRRYKLTKGKITDDQVFAIYSDITGVIEYQKANGGDQARLEKIAEYVDKLLTSTVKVDCDFVDTNLGPKFKETHDIKLAKTIFTLLKDQSCLDRPLATEAAETINQSTPDFGISKFIAQKYANDGDLDKAMQYYEQAISLTDDNSKKSDVHLSIARIHSNKGDKAAARNSARRAISFYPSSSEAYKLIGDLYMTSFTECKAGVSKVVDRGVFLAAYDMYQKAGDSDAMSRAREQFPSIEEIFNETYKEGEVIQVGCWINQSVKIERRPAN